MYSFSNYQLSIENHKLAERVYHKLLNVNVGYCDHNTIQQQACGSVMQICINKGKVWPNILRTSI